MSGWDIEIGAVCGCSVEMRAETATRNTPLVTGSDHVRTPGELRISPPFSLRQFVTNAAQERHQSLFVSRQRDEMVRQDGNCDVLKEREKERRERVDRYIADRRVSSEITKESEFDY